MPSGKLAAQCCHASVAVFLNKGTWDVEDGLDVFKITNISPAMKHWMGVSFPKAVLGIETEYDIEVLFAEAQRAGLPCSKIIDTGRTVYNGEHNLTCIAIGPAERSEIDKITGHLPLYKDPI